MRSAIVIKCSGEAHGNAYIDNCWSCAPWWGAYPACPDCKCKLAIPDHVSTSRATRGRCRNSACASVRRWFSLPKSEDFDALAESYEDPVSTCGRCGEEYTGLDCRRCHP